MKKGAKKLKEIASGWARFAFPDQETEDMAKKRAIICSKCPSSVHGTWIEYFAGDSKITELSGLKCGECNCPLSAKTRSKTSSCPLKKW